jgi:hypothetical protein
MTTGTHDLRLFVVTVFVLNATLALREKSS